MDPLAASTVFLEGKFRHRYFYVARSTEKWRSSFNTEDVNPRNTKKRRRMHRDDANFMTPITRAVSLFSPPPKK
jgi:hypothetical protein